MRRIRPEVRPPAIWGVWNLSELSPDRRFAPVSDHLARNQYVQGGLQTSHTTLTVGDEQAEQFSGLQRVRSVQVGPVSGGTVTVQVQVEGRDIFDDASRPVSGGAVQEPTDVYLMPAGTPVVSIIEADSGTPASDANVVLEIESYVLAPKIPHMVLHGKDRYRISRRRSVEIINSGGSELPPHPLGGVTRDAILHATSPSVEQLRILSGYRILNTQRIGVNLLGGTNTWGSHADGLPIPRPGRGPGPGSGGGPKGSRAKG